MKKEEKKQCKILIERTKHWNDGAGLIVPPAMAKALKKMGINKGYKTNRKIN